MDQGYRSGVTQHDATETKQLTKVQLVVVARD